MAFSRWILTQCSQIAFLLIGAGWMFYIFSVGLMPLLKLKTFPKQKIEFKNVNFWYNIEVGAEKCEKNKTLLIGIPSRSHGIQRRMEVRRTWLKNLNSTITYRFFVAYSANETVRNAYFKEAEVYGDMIIVDIFDSYSTLIYKTYAIMNWQQEYCQNVKYILKIDDDTIINIPRLLYWIQNDFDKEYNSSDGKAIFGATLAAVNLVTNYTLKWNNQTGIEYCQGFTYLFTSIAAKSILKVTTTESFMTAEDVMFTGLLAEAAGVKRFHRPKHFTKGPIKTDCGCDDNGVPYLTSVYLHLNRTVDVSEELETLEKFSCEDSKNISRIQFFASCFA